MKNSGFKANTVQTPDGVGISVQDWGNRDGPEILFIHGFSQSHLCWLRQAKSGLAETFRMVTYDLRGHGGSGKPLDPEYYKENRRWADEAKAVIEGANLRKPVLIGWSYGGRVILDYLMQYGDEGIAGLSFVSAVTKIAPGLFGSAHQALPKMASENPAENIENTLAFLRFCTARPLPPEEFEVMVAYNMMVPPKVRLNMSDRPTPYEEALKRIKVPVRVIHGVEDQVVLAAMGRYTASVVPNAKASFYEGVGHSPFWEDAARFNQEVAEFVTAATGN